MTTGQNLAEGAAGIALLHLETGNWEAAHANLEQAVTGGVSIGDGASLYYGAPALAFVLAASDQPGLTRAKAIAAAGTATVTRHRLQGAHRRIDQRQRPTYAEFDLIRGLTGLGVTLRRIGDLDLLREVLSYLVRLTEPIDWLPGWWCPTGPNRNQPGPAGGHSNHGMAHGVTGPLALMALAVSDGVEVDGQRAAITRICQWLDHWERHSDGGAWWPEISRSMSCAGATPASQARCGRPGATEPQVSPAPSSSPPAPWATPLASARPRPHSPRA